VFPGWVLQGLPGVHAFHTSSDWNFCEPVRLGDRIIPESIFTGFDFVETRFAGSSIMECQEGRYNNQHGGLVGRVRVSGLRAERMAARERAKYANLKLPHPWSRAELLAIEDQILMQQRRGNERRYWEDVQLGDCVDELVTGPLGLSDMMAYVVGALPVNLKAHRLALQEYQQHPAWAFRDPLTSALEPAFGVHYNGSAAMDAGLPYPFDIGTQRHCWLMSMLANWMGDHAWLKRCYARYTGFVFLSDVLWMAGKVVDRYQDEEGEYCVDIETSAVNQRSEEVMPGMSTIILPSREDDAAPVERRVSCDKLLPLAD